MMTPNGNDDARLLRALEERCRDVPEGTHVDLGDLEAQDKCGAKLFALLAARFGCKREDSGRWLRERVPRWTPGWVEAQHEEQWMVLFESAFGYRMAPELFRWKYRHMPLHGMGAWREGRLVAFYGGMARDVLHFGKPARVLQIGDIMTRPDERATTRTGPYHIAATTYIERTSGYGMPFLFGFGFPNVKSLRIGERMRIYEEVDQMLELSWSPADSFAAGFDAMVPLDATRAKTVDGLWSTMAGAMQDSVVGVRNWAYLADRFGTHPLNTYELMLVRNRLTLQPKGVIVCRDRGDNGLEVLDLVGHPAKWPGLVRALQRRVARTGKARAFMWATKSHAAMLASTSPRSQGFDAVVPANIWTPGPPPAQLRDRWWLTGGDTDIR